jgi:proline iminopeptidase
MTHRQARLGVVFLTATAALVLAATGVAQTPRPKVFRSGSLELTYYETGPRRGTPLVLLSGGPGFDSDYFWFGPAFHELGRTRWVLSYDQRGTGRSAPVGAADTVTIADMVADLEGLRIALGVPQLDLLGHSWGGYLAMAYAATHPERVAHLVLVGSAAPKFSDTIFLFSQVFPERDMSEPFARGRAANDPAIIKQALDIYTSMIFYSPEKGAAWRKLGARLKYNHHQSGHLSRDLGRQDFTPRLATFRFPTLVTTGRYDMNVAPLVAYRIHQAIPGSRLEVFERSSHIPFYEEPTAFVRILRAFLATR